MTTKSRGYTLYEILIVLWFGFVIALMCAGLYVGVHFIMKFW